MNNSQIFCIYCLIGFIISPIIVRYVCKVEKQSYYTFEDILMMFFGIFFWPIYLLGTLNFSLNKKTKIKVK